MLRVEYKICRKCKRTYRWTSGGIVMTPRDYMDMGLCEICRAKETIGILGKIINKK